MTAPLILVPATPDSEWIREAVPWASPAELPVAGQRFIDYAIEGANQTESRFVEILDACPSPRLAADFGEHGEVFAGAEIRERLRAARFIRYEHETLRIGGALDNLGNLQILLFRVKRARKFTGGVGTGGRRVRSGGKTLLPVHDNGDRVFFLEVFQQAFHLIFPP